LPVGAAGAVARDHEPPSSVSTSARVGPLGADSFPTATQFAALGQSTPSSHPRTAGSPVCTICQSAGAADAADSDVDVDVDVTAGLDVDDCAGFDELPQAVTSRAVDMIEQIRTGRFPSTASPFAAPVRASQSTVGGRVSGVSETP
jgi:hypothetical protein